MDKNDLYQAIFRWMDRPAKQDKPYVVVISGKPEYPNLQTALDKLKK